MRYDEHRDAIRCKVSDNTVVTPPPPMVTTNSIKSKKRMDVRVLPTTVERGRLLIHLANDPFCPIGTVLHPPKYVLVVWQEQECLQGELFFLVTVEAQ